MSVLKPNRRADRKPNAKYLDYVRSMPCCVCAKIEAASSWRETHPAGTIQQTRTEAAHTGPHALGQKSADSTAIPLCMEHHREGRESYHKMGPVVFAACWLIDIPKLPDELWERFEAEAGRGESALEAREARA